MKVFVRLLMLALLLALPGEEVASWPAGDDDEVITGYGAVPPDLMDHGNAAACNDTDADGADLLFQRATFAPPLPAVSLVMVAAPTILPRAPISSLFRPPRA